MQKNKTNNKIIQFKPATDTGNEKKLSWKSRLLLDVIATLIACILIMVIMLIVGQYKNAHTGFKNRDDLLKTYFQGLNTASSSKMSKCFYPNTQNSYDSVSSQTAYAKSETKTTTWYPDKIKTEWTPYTDITKITDNLGSISINEAASAVAIIPLEQTTSTGIKVEEEDVYQFITHKTGDKWYIASFIQTARNVTGAISDNGVKMTDNEVTDWLYSLANEIGSDKVGYLFVDDYWQSADSSRSVSDDQIKAYATIDGSSYMTMAVIKDSDIKDFKAYAASIISQSDQKYTDIMNTTGVIGSYDADVEIAQNESTNAKIIIWIFKTDKNDKYTHVITLEATSDYDASTYINTFHLKKQHTADVSGNTAD